MGDLTPDLRNLTDAGDLEEEDLLYIQRSQYGDSAASSVYRRSYAFKVPRTKNEIPEA